MQVSVYNIIWTNSVLLNRYTDAIENRGQGLNFYGIGLDITVIK